ncbi:carbohydrate ABC transporter permease [Leifsonia sp. NCR5]|uniref:carbohydrate ABC transporter permease n=1 Tax=Leifsonia sp. NCR5 TaxID=1978342 RepID=UPI000A18B5EF|nr:sugar ABC transporter permease [Leifsonia sp. NCR5]
MTSPQRRGRGRAYLYLAPALLVYLTFVILPYLQTIWYSLYEWDGVGEAVWVGLGNYASVFTQPALISAIQHAFGYIVFFSFLPIAIGLVLAAIVAGDTRRNWTIPRAIIFLPQIVPLVASGIAWTFIYSQDGLINQVLRAVGLGDYARAWLGDFTWAYPAVGIVGTWVGIGLCMVLFISGIQKIDHGLYEAVRLDGGGRIREFFTITIRQLRGEISVALTLTVISALASFDVIFIMTGGGPGSSTTVPGVTIYRLAFSYNQIGLGAALGIVLSLLVYILVLGINAIFRERPSAH